MSTGKGVLTPAAYDRLNNDANAARETYDLRLVTNIARWIGLAANRSVQVKDVAAAENIVEAYLKDVAYVTELRARKEGAA